MAGNILRIINLSVRYSTKAGFVHAVNHVSLSLKRGQILGLVGESGCGKTTIADTILDVLQSNAAVTGGRILFNPTAGTRGYDPAAAVSLLRLPAKRRREAITGRIGMIFQDPVTAFNPSFTVGYQMTGAIMAAEKGLPRKAAVARAVKLLKMIEVDDPAKRLGEFPHELSDGTLQRIMIAMALARRPDILVADEPTSAMDMTVQATILELLSRLRDELGLSIIFITHDLGIVSNLCDKVVVMYGGQVCERGSAEDVIDRPAHPYVKGLMDATPNFGCIRERLAPIDGMPPELTEPPRGCAFYARCPEAADKCRDECPEEIRLSRGRRVACWHFREGGGA